MTLPAGKYYVGDLYYVANKEWDKIIGLVFEGRNQIGGANEGIFTLSNNRKFATFFTANGDGTFLDQKNRQYLVDSGSIGCILVSDIIVNETTNFDNGNIIDFHEPFEVSGGRYGDNYESWNSVINIGSVQIDTSTN